MSGFAAPAWWRQWWLGGIRLPLALGTALLVAYPLAAGSPYHLRLLTVAGIYALMVLGYQYIFGQAGALSLTQGAFFGLGAYATGILGSQLGWGFVATFPLSIAIPVLLAVAIAWPVLRLESHYVALATLGISQVLLLVAIKAEALTGGPTGLTGVPPVVLLGAALPAGWPSLLFVWGLLALGAALAWWIVRGRYGLACRVMRDNPLAAQTVGLDIGRLRLAALLLSAGYAGAAGALYVHTLRVVSTEVLEFPVMIACLTMTVVGGSTRVAGAILGAVLLVHLPEWLRALDRFYLIAYGGLLLGMIVVAPYGLIGALERWRGARLGPEPPATPPAPIARHTKTMRAADRGRSLLEARGVSLRFGGVHALTRVDLVVEAGAIVGLIGPNGSGKTSLVNVMTGLYRPDDGTVALAGEALTGRPIHAIARAGVARTFQTLALVDDMTALDTVAVARLARQSGGLRAARLALARGQAMTLLDALGIADSAMARCGALAHGVRRRVEIARALALEPRVLLLDEPAAGLNPIEQRDLAELLTGLANDGLSLLVIEHNMGFLMPLATHLVCLDHGEVIASGTPAAMQRDPRVIEAYLGTAETAA